MISLMDGMIIPFCFACLLMCVDTGLSLLYLMSARCSFSLCLKALFVSPMYRVLHIEHSSK